MPTLVTRKIRRPELPRSAKILIAVLLAAIFHLLFLLLLVWALPYWPKARTPARSAPFRLTITKSTPAPETSVPAVSSQSTPPYIRTLDEQASAKPPDQPDFQSDKDTLAAAELAAAGNKPLPTLQGKDIPEFDFDTRPARLDKVAADAATAAPASPTDSKKPSKDKERHPKAQKTVLDSKAKPSAQPQPTATPPAGELATLKSQPSPTPQPTPEEFPGVTPTPPPPEADPLARESPVNPATPSTVTSRGLPKRPGYQPETIQTRMAGSISNRGRPAPGAIGTPFGRYQKTISDQVGMRWYHYVAEQADLISVGSVKIHFVIAADGHVHDVTVVSGIANGVLADVSEQAINEAEIPPIPPDVAATLSGNQMEMDFDFSEY